MGKRRQLNPQSIWDPDAVQQAFEQAGAKLHHIPRMYNYMIKHPGASWRDVPDLPLKAVAALDAGFVLHTTRLLRAQRSSDGETTKLLVQLQDGLQVESVIMEYDNTERYAGGPDSAPAAAEPPPPPPAAACSQQDAPALQQLGSQQAAEPPEQQHPDEFQQQQAGARAGAELQQDQQQAQDQHQDQQQDQQQDNQDDEDDEGDDEEFHDAASSLGELFGGSLRGGRRATLCVSSEIGCAMGCTFCATGTMGLTSDLTTGEIIEQLVYANTVHSIRNVVFMGMGEPLNNYAAVRSAVSMMTDPRFFGLRRKKVTVSTVGVIPRLLQMADDMPGVSLALSLHAPTQELRQTIVPSAKAFKLDRLMAAVDEYQRRTRQQVFVEYVLLGPNVNCTAQHAHELGALLQGRDVLVNIIPWNPILSPSISFAAPEAGATATFQSILRHQYGVNCTIRAEKGQDISGACGQLVLEHGGRLPSADSASGGGGACGGGSGSGGNGGGIADVEDLLPPLPRAAAAAAVAAQ